MKQILQDMAKGRTTIAEAPSPAATAGTLLIASSISLISSGTERMLVEFGKASPLAKARQQPEKVAQVLEKMRTDGIFTTIDAVRSKLAQPLPLGYCNAGVVVAVGAGVEGWKPGDRVASNGPHADIVRVPRNLCVRIPDAVTDEQAAFTVAASIGLQGVRLAQPQLGECVAVTGAGLIGLLTIQLLRAQGCRVLAIDFDARKLKLAASFGAETCNPANGEDPVAAGLAFSRGRGIDAVIVTASTKSSDPIAQAARMSRKRGRIILVGVTGLELNRGDFYEKELTFQVSCSYGPGRYDTGYELKGQDYPVGFVRWTEQRNFEAVLDMMAAGSLDTAPLVSHRYEFEDAPEAYRTLQDDKGALGILLRYGSPVETRIASRIALQSSPQFAPGSAVLGVIGAGNYAPRILIPALKAAGAALHTVVTSGGINGAVEARKTGFAHAASEASALLADPLVSCIAIATRHDTHASLAAQALAAGKHVFVEKPLAIDRDGLTLVREAFDNAQSRGQGPQLMVGYNRRFAPHVQRMKALLDTVKEPKSFIMTMNAGAVPADHWTQDLSIGGGRIIGEACHYIDLMLHLCGAPIVSVQARRMGDAPGLAVAGDKAAIMLGFADGSFGTIHYLANGAASFPKERIEAFAAGRILQLDNFVKLRGYNWPGFSRLNLWRQDKGQAACAKAFVEAVKSGVPAIPPGEIFEVARVTLDVADALRAQ